MSDPHLFHLRIEPHVLACFTCSKFEMDDSADVVWCVIDDPQFPALCARYEHRNSPAGGGVVTPADRGDSLVKVLPQLSHASE